VVSSGAVALGRMLMNTWQPSLPLDEKQALAALGQITLSSAWQEALNTVGLRTAQVLITQDDTDDRVRHLNARATINHVLAWQAVPVINENDTVATAEIRYGDNDRLAAKVAAMTQADLLILLSDIDGLYTKNPKTDATATHIPIVDEITKDILSMAGGVGSSVSSGGMYTKIQAATIATLGGVSMVISDGRGLHPLATLLHGAKHTLFHASTTPRRARKHWIASLLNVMGSITIDDGAVTALTQGKSLLPAGIQTVTGQFDEGDAVSIHTRDGQSIGQGLVQYPSSDIRKIMGHRSTDIESILGYQGKKAVMHRDDLVLYS
jgi:glutamate 5-kinase